MLPRIIPTRVGTSYILFCDSPYHEDHPHACGDKSNEFFNFFQYLGSSPRVWGQVAIELSSVIRQRIIPTRVGTSIYFFTFNKFIQDHPHACGDKKRKENSDAISLGSSPRVWGQEIAKNPLTSCFRIIPTRVGTRLLRSTVLMLSWDHPHACGDKTGRRRISSLSEGSSPRVWGQDCFDNFSHVCLRIIPTRVGTRYTDKRFYRYCEDHPHACGDKLYSVL